MIHILRLEYHRTKGGFLFGTGAVFLHKRKGGIEFNFGERNRLRFINFATDKDPQGYHKNAQGFGSFIAGYVAGRFAVSWEHHTRLEMEKLHEKVWGSLDAYEQYKQAKRKLKGDTNL